MTSPDEVRRSVLDAARAAYAARGFVGTTIKGVAATAGVTPDVVRRYYHNREELFAAAMRLPYEPSAAISALVAPGLDGIGEGLVRVTLTTFSRPETIEQLSALVRAGSGAHGAATTLREFLEVAVVDRVAGALGVPDARMRVALATSYLVGVALSRYVLRLEPLASAGDDEVVALVAPAVQAALVGR